MVSQLQEVNPANLRRDSVLVTDGVLNIRRQEGTQPEGAYLDTPRHEVCIADIWRLLVVLLVVEDLYAHVPEIK